MSPLLRQPWRAILAFSLILGGNLPGPARATGPEPTIVESDGPITISEALTVDGPLIIRAGEIRISAPIRANGVHLESAGQLAIEAPIAAFAGRDGGTIDLNGAIIMIGAPVSAVGKIGGRISASAEHVIQWQPIQATGTAGPGGAITVRAGGRYLSTADGALEASGLTGGSIQIVAGGRAYSSAPVQVIGMAGPGGMIAMSGGSIVLAAATLDASGQTGGGQIDLGADPGSIEITPAAKVRADARLTGNGGAITIDGTERILPAGSFSAHGGIENGDGGAVVLLTPGDLGSPGSVDVSARAGQAGRVLADPKNLTVSAAGLFPHYDLINPSPNAGDRFGDIVVALPSGNVVVTAPNDDTMAPDAGAVYLFDGVSGALKSTLFGSRNADAIGDGDVKALTNGNYVIVSSLWDNGLTVDAGAVTWANGATGVSGVVGAANSLVGTATGDRIGSGKVFTLTNGNYVVSSPLWNNLPEVRVGAATWGNGATGTVGPVTTTNSLHGTTSEDAISYDGIRALSNGHYVVLNHYWNRGAVLQAGAVTWGNGGGGTTGPVSIANSLVGSREDDRVGLFGAVALSNGNYVVRSPDWANGVITRAGAATWGNGAGGTTGPVSITNSLVGSKEHDMVGSNGIVALTNGNYVVASSNWDRGGNIDAGAVTWGNGATGTSGAVGFGNSLVGALMDDRVGSGGVVALSNGNYVAVSPAWNRNLVASTAGAVTWGNGAGGTTGFVSAANSLVGSTDQDQVGSNGVIALANGNYVVASQSWNRGVITDAGAVTWGNGATGSTGPVTVTNSLVGSSANDRVGNGGVDGLPNGHYVVASPDWDRGAIDDAGAVTWRDGSVSTSGTIGLVNSVVGSTASDRIGGNGVVVLPNNSYVIVSSNWNRGGTADVGAVTWRDGSAGTSLVVAETNSLVGSSANDRVGLTGVTVLPNGNYVVASRFWKNGGFADSGAVTWGSGTSGIVGPIDGANSILGRAATTDLVPVQTDATSGTFLARFVGENGGRISAGFDDPNQLTFRRGESQSIGIQPSFLIRTLSTGAAVTIEASNDLSITVPIAPVNAGGAAGALTSRAGRSIFVNASITTDDAPITFLANEPLSAGIIDSQRDPGIAVIRFETGSSIQAGAGPITMRLADGAGKTNRQLNSISLPSLTGASLVAESAGFVSIPNGAAVSLPFTIVANSGTIIQSGGSLAGTGTISGGLTLKSGGQLTPGLSPGTISINGTLEVEAGGTITFELGAPGATDRIDVSGDVFLGGPLVLTTLPGFVPGSLYKLIDHTGSGPITGTFASLPEGAPLTLAGRDYRITYQGGDGNDVVLYPATTFVYLPIVTDGVAGGW